MTMPEKPNPAEFVTDELDGPFWEGTSQHKLLIQQCSGCDRYYWPATVCISCGDENLPWVEAKGIAKVHTYTVIHRPFLMAWAADVPYNVAVVELVEGPFMFTNIVNCENEDIKVGMEVEVVFEDQVNGGSLPKFRPIGPIKQG